MKFAKYFFVSLMFIMLFGCNEANETEESINNSVSVNSSKAEEKEPPVNVDKKVIQNID